MRWWRRRPPPPWLGSRPRVRQLGDDDVAGGRVAVRLHVAADLPAELDFKLTVADRSGDVAAGADQQALADDEVALERAAHVGVVDLGRALEQTALGDID